MKATKKAQIFCSDCGLRLSDSIYPPALSRKHQGRYASGNLKPNRYVCHECGVRQAWEVVKEVR